jgi:hypothetical protein
MAEGDGRAEDTQQHQTTRSDHPAHQASPWVSKPDWGWSYLLWVLPLHPITQVHAHVRKLSWQRLPARGACAATSGHQQLQASLVQRVPAQSSGISGSRARLCPALLEAAVLPSLFGPPVELVAPLVRTMVRVRLSSHTAWEACRGLRHSSQEERLGL